MKSSMLKYKCMCIAVICCAMFTACETSPDELSYKNPISFGDRKNADDAVNALLWGYYGDTWIYGTENENGTEVTGQNATVTIVDGGTGTSTSTLIPKDVATRYWAQTDVKYNFYAMWPLEGSNHGISAVKYTNNTITFNCDITKQTDICIAATLNQTSQWNVLPTNLQPVNLHFQHMLSKVQFIGRSASSAVEIVSASINVPTTASAVYSHNGTDLSIGYTLGAVSTLSTPENFSMTIPESTAIDITNGGWLVFPGTTADITFTVTYKTGVTDANGNPEIKYVYGEIPVTTVTSWERGKNYIYNFTIQPSGPIIFGGISVTPWASQPETEFDFPTEP